jgi:hypothetical protein
MRGPFGINVNRDAEEGEGLSVTAPSLDELLPHGQLLAAHSPAGPHEQQGARASQAPGLEDLAVKGAQRQVGHRVADPGSIGSVRTAGRLVHKGCSSDAVVS